LVFSGMDRGKIFERLVISSLVEIWPLINWRVVETGLRAAWFGPSLGRFPGI